MRLLKIYLLICLVALFFKTTALSQVENKDSVPQSIDNINLKFNLAIYPPENDLWFSDKSGYWKFKYELRLTDDKTLKDLQEKIYSKYRKSDADSQWLVKANKELYKKWRKSGRFIGKGSIRRSQLLPESNRDLTVSVNLPEEAKQILNRMTDSTELPNLLLFVKGKISLKSATGEKYTKKYDKTLENPMKFYKNEGEYLLYNTFGMSVNLIKERGNIVIEISRR